MTFLEWKRAKEKEEQGKSSASTTSTTKTASTTPSTGDTSAKSNDRTGDSFLVWVRKNKTEQASDSMQSWYDGGRSLLNEVNQYYSNPKWGGDSDYYSDFQSRASNLLASADGWRKQYAGNKEALSAIDSMVSALGNMKQSAMKATDYYTKFESEDDFNIKVGYANKYQGKTYDEIMAASAEAKGSEAEWLKSYSENYGYADDNYYSAYTKSVDDRIAEIDAKIEEAKAAGKTQKYDHRNVYGNDSYARQNEIDALEEERTGLLAQKKRTQYKREGYEHSAVADPNSSLYDPEFEKYAEIGKQHYEDTRYDSDEAASTMPSWNFDQKGSAPPKEYTEWKDKLYSFEYANMEEDERNVYHYWLGKAKEEAGGGEIDESTAERYVELITEAINTRRGQKMANDINDQGKLMQMAFSVYSGLESYGTGMKNFFSSEDEYIPATATAVASQGVREDMHEDHPLWGVAYDVANTGANMAPSLAMSFVPYAGTALYLGSMGASSAGHAYADAINQGYSVSDARLYSTAIGATEVGLSYLLDGVIAGGGKLSNAALGKLTSKVKNAAVKAIFNFAGKSGSEFLEENLQEGLFEPVWSNVFLKTDKDVDLLSEEALYSGLLGALSAAGHNAVGSAVSAAVKQSDYKDAKATYGDAESLQGLIAEGLENPTSKKLAKKLQARVDGKKNVSGRAIYNLVQANEEAIRSEDIDTMKTAAAERLQTLGESGDVSAISDVIAKQASGETLTKSEQDVLKNSKYGIRVSNEMSPSNVGTGEYSNAWAESIGTNRINKGAYNYAENQALFNLAKETAGVSTPIAEESAVDGDELLKEAKAMPAVKIPSADDFGTSADGKTRISSTDTEVTIKGVKVIESKDKKGDTVKQYQFKVVDNDGNESFVDTSDIDYASTSEGLLFESFVDLGIDPAYFDSYVANFNSNDFKYKFGDIAAEVQYAYGFNEAVNFGKAGLDGGYKTLTEDGKTTVSSTYLENGTFTKGLKESVRNLAYNLGKTASDNRLEAEAKAIDEAVLKRKESGKGKVKEKGRFHFEQRANEVLNKQQRAGLLVAKRLTSLGNDVYIFRSTVDENGNRVDDRGELCPNGKYYGKDGSIHLDLYAGGDGSGLMVYTAAHELLHNGRRYAQREFKIFKKLLYEWYGEQYDPAHHGSLDQLIKQRMEDEGVSWDVAEEEVLADFCEPFLTDGNIEERVAQLKATDEETFNFVHKVIKKIWDLVKSIYSKINPDSTEGQFSREHKDSLERVYDAFAKMTYAASENLQWTGGMTLDTAEVSVSEDGVIQMQQRHYNEKNSVTGKSGRDSLLDYLENRYGKDDANSLISTIDSINAVMDEIKADHPELQIFSQWQDSEIEIDENGKPIFTTSIKNGDYELNQDFSRVCKKRRQLDFVLNLLAEDPNFKAEYLTKKDFVEINNAIKKHGFEIACALCFVDSKRFRQAEWADSFANTWNDILESVMVKGSKPTPFNFATNKANVADEGIQIDLTKPITIRKWSDGKVSETRHYDNIEHLLSKAMKNGKEAYVEGNSNIRTIATLIRDNPSLRHTFRGADIISSTGFDAVQRLAPSVRNILDGWGGSSVPKPSSMDASYDNSILNIKGYNEEAAFAMGGVRMNSFSDFMAHMFFDYCEAFADLSAKGLPMQSYTKELIFARLFGKSGGKINMSGIAAIRENTPPMKENKKAGITKAQAEKNIKIEKMLAGLDVSRLTEHLQKDVSELTESDLEEFLDMCDYLWADESINMTQATLLQSGILYDKLSETKQAECYELLKQGKFDEAFKVAGKENVDKEYAKHIGTIVVGVSDAHIRKLLRDPTIRMVIPYHKSSLNPQIAQLLKIAVYNDYTDVQSTGVLVKGAPKRVNLSSTAIQDSLGLVDFSFYDYFGKTIDGVTYDGRETANKYLEWCEKGVYDEKVGDYVYYTKKGDGYILAKKLHERYTIVPKFDAFKGEINYYKVLEDFDCYDTITGEHSPQEAVQFLQKGLPADYKDVLVKELQKEQELQESFRDHLDNQGLKDEIMGIVKKNGYKATEGIGIGRKVSDDDAKKSTRKKRDADYLDAYYDGDDELMQKLVDEAAYEAGYRYKAYHHTENGFTVFDLSKARTSMDIQGFFFSADKEAEREYGSVRYDTYLKMDNPYIVDSKEKQNAIPFDMSKSDAGIIAREWLQSQGYDGVIRKAEYFGAEADEYIVFDSSQIKSSEPMTFEDDEYGEGDVIPLSKRFDSFNDDIRYSTRKKAPTFYSKMEQVIGDIKKSTRKDSRGKQLSDGQQEFFKYSKVVDANGDLKVMYHGTPNGEFNTFRISEGSHSPLMSQYGAGYYFDENRDSAKRYTENVNKSGGKRNPKVFEVYLNITNPLEITDSSHVVTKKQLFDVISRGNDEWFFTDWMPFSLKNWLGKSKSEIQQMPRQDIMNSWVDMTFERAYYDSDILSEMVRAFRGDSILTAMKEVFGKDGVKVTDKYGEMWVAWDSNQIKETSNLKPTESDDIRYSKRKKQDVSNKGLSYASLVALPDLTGTVLKKNQQVKMTLNGKVDDAWLRKQVIDQCDSVDMPGTLPAHYLYSDALGENVEITKDAILHGHQKSIGKNARNPVPRELLNARAMLDLRSLLKNAFVVNLSTKHTNKDSPYAYVMMSVMGMEDANGNVDYYAVRLLVQERFQGNATLLGANVLGRLSAVNAKKIDLPHPRNVSIKNTSLKHSGQFGYSVADLLGDVKNIFPDTFTNDVYANLGMKRVQSDKLSNHLVYQTRKSGTSARSLLANALESVTQSDIERNKLNQYKEKIDLLNEEEAKLRELNEELRKLSFPEKGTKRDQKRINDLRFEANHTVSRINTLDKMLFDLEASAPLKKVLQREKDAVKKKYEQQGKAMAREKVKEKAESISKKLAKKDLEKIVLDTARWLRSPKKDEVKCPDVLRVPFAEFLDSIDMSSKRLLRGGEATQNDLRIAAAMDSLATSIEKIRNAQDPSTEASNNGIDAGYLDLPTNFVENIRLMSESIKRLMGMSDTGCDIMQEMSSEEMKTLIHVIKTLKKAIRDMQRLYTNYRFANAVTLGQNTMTFVDELGEFNGKIPGLKDFYVWQNTVPYYAFKRFGEAGESIFESFMDAQDKQAFLADEIQKFAKDTWTTKEVKAWSEDVHTILLPSGSEITLTTADAMNLYCLARRQHAGGHLVGYGVRVMGIKKGAKKLSDSIAVFTEEDVADIVESKGKTLKLTDRQVEVAEAMQKFMSTTCSEWGNEISMKRFLTRMFTETNYVPIESDSEGLDTKDPEAKKSDLFRLLNISATKPLTENANNRIIVRNLFDVFTEHSNDMARLNAWGMALLDYMKWMNYREKYQTPDGKNKQVGVRQSIRTAYGDAATSYLLNFIKDVNGVGDGGRSVGWVEKMFSHGKTASVGANLRVAALQLTAYPRAALVLSPKSLAMGAAKLKPSIAKAKKYCGIALWKSFGYYDTDVSRSMEAQIKGDTTVMDRIKDASMWLAGKADEVTWGYLWNACEAEVAATGEYEKGTEEFNIAVGKKLREVVYSSQVVDSVLTRSQLMRSKNSFAKMASSFMSEPTMTHNITLDCMMQYNIEKRKTGSKKAALAKTWKHTARATSTLMLTTLAVALVGGLWSALRDDDDDPFDEKFTDAAIGSLLEELIPLSRLPLASDITSLIASKFGIGYFASSNMTTDYLTTIGKAWDAWADIINNGEDAQKTVYYALFNTVKGLSQFTGVPASNAMRDVVSLWNSTVGDADYTMKIRTYEPSDSANAENLYQAIVSGDTKWQGKLESLWVDETERQKDLKKVIGDHYVAGDLDLNTASNYLEEYCGMDDEDIHWQMDRWQYTAETGSSDGYSKYDDFITAVETGKNLKAVIQEYTTNGVEKNTLASQITSHFKPLYKEMSKSERASLKGYLLNAYSVLGYDRSKKSKDIDKWLED